MDMTRLAAFVRYCYRERKKLERKKHGKLHPRTGHEGPQRSRNIVLLFL
jgi:hypothetical protein